MQEYFHLKINKEMKGTFLVDTGDIVELDDNMTDEEIEQELSEYVNDRLDWNYRRVEDD